VKAGKAKATRRVEEFVRIILDGAEPFDLRPYVTEKQAKPGSPWELTDGDKPLSDRQIRRYAAAAERVIAESCRTSRRRLLRRHLARRRNLYAKAVNAGDLRTALAVLADEARLLNLYEPFARRGPADGAGGPMAAGDVVRVLSDRLRQLDRADLPAGEVARLSATVADSLLRAIGIGVLDGRLEALQAVLVGRKDRGT
jgi:hypothetical protein